MKNKKIITIWLLIIVSSLTLAPIIFANLASRSAADDAYYPVPSTPEFPIEAENRFIKMVGQDIELNSGITLIRPSFGLVINGPTPNPNNVSFIVFNHTDEPILFKDMGFGLKVFWFDQEVLIWNQIMLPYTPQAVQKILPARLEEYSPSVTNQWFIFSDEFRLTPHKELRLFVEGVGTITNKKYGAFLDLTLAP